jgi:hypothetical protein
VHTTGFDPVHTPARQLSLCVQASPSSHAAPSAFGVTVHVEVPLQVTVLHWSSVQVIDVPPHTPDVQTSP